MSTIQIKRVLLLAVMPLVLALSACGGSGPDRSVFSSYNEEYCFYYPVDCYGGNIYFHHAYHSRYGYGTPSATVVHHYTPRPSTYFVQKQRTVAAQKKQAAVAAQKKAAAQKAAAKAQSKSSSYKPSRPSSSFKSSSKR